jgi:hypothetical protein
MVRSYKKIIAFKEDWQIFILLTFLYSIFLWLKYLLQQEEIWKFLYDTFLFYFEATLSEFKNWFPRFGLWLFIFVSVFKFFCFLLGGFIFYKVLKRIKIKFDKSIPITDFSFNSFLFKQIIISSCLLAYYVGLYFLFRFYYTNNFSDFQILIARGFLLQIVFQIFRNVINYRFVLADYLKLFFFEPQLPYSISILRILFFSYLAYIYFIAFSLLPTVSLSTKVALPLMGWFIDILPINAEIYTYFIYLGLVCCLFIVIGLKTRFFLIINSICVFYIIATPNFFGKLWHEQLVIWIVWFFMFSRCYDVFSLDAFIKKTAVVKSANYTFPVRFVWIQFGIIYFWAGFYKLWDSGFEWTFGSSMINQVQLEWVQGYDKIPEIRIDHAPIILYLGGLLAIILELTYIFFVLRPKWRWVSVFGGLLMHNLIGYFMYISFLEFVQVFYVFYFDFNQFFKKNIKIIEIKKSFSRLSFYSGITILVMNGFFGLLHIDSYPFSSYPSYSAIIPDKVKIIDFRSSKLNKSVHEIGKSNHFRWEDYCWLEDNLIKDFESGKNVKKRIEDYWDIWVKRNPQLKFCDTINVYLIERPVAPEGKYKTVCLKKMGIIIK